MPLKMLILTYDAPMFQNCSRCLLFLGCKMISSLLSIETCVHVIDNGINEISFRVGMYHVCKNEKQLIKFVRPNYKHYTYVDSSCDPGHPSYRDGIYIINTILTLLSACMDIRW